MYVKNYELVRRYTHLFNCTDGYICWLKKVYKYWESSHILHWMTRWFFYPLLKQSSFDDVRYQFLRSSIWLPIRGQACAKWLWSGVSSCHASFRTVSVSLWKQILVDGIWKTSIYGSAKMKTIKRTGWLQIIAYKMIEKTNLKERKQPHHRPGNILSHLLSNDSSIHCLELSRFAEFYTDVLTGSLS